MLIKQMSSLKKKKMLIREVLKVAREWPIDNFFQIS